MRIAHVIFGFSTLVALAMMSATGVPCASAQQEAYYRGHPLSAWIADLKSKHELERRAAARAISALGPLAPRAAEPLMRAYTIEGHQELRELYLQALSDIGPGATAALPLLYEHIRTEERLAERIAKIDPKLEESKKFLDRYVREKNVKAAASMLQGFAHLARITKEPDNATKTIAQALDAPVAEIRLAAANALAAADPTFKRVQPEIVRLLTGKDEKLALPVLEAIQQTRTPVVHLAKPLMQGLSHPNAEVRVATVKAIANIDPDFKAVPEIIDRVFDAKDEKLALTFLDAIRSDHVVKKLLPGLEHPSVPVQKATLRAVLRLDPGLRRLPQAFALVLAENDVDLLLSTLDAIAAMGPDAERPAKSLLSAMDHPHAEVRLAAIQAIASVDPKVQEDKVMTARALTILEASLNSRDRKVQKRALAAVELFRDHGKRLRPTLDALLKDRDETIRDAATFAVWLVENPQLNIRGTSPLAFAPPDAEVVMHLQLRSLLELLFIKNQFLDDIRREIKQYKVLEPFKIDVVTDVTSLTLAVRKFTPGKEWTDHDGLLILKGRFLRAVPMKLIESDERGQTFYAMCLNPQIILVSNRKDQILDAVKRATRGPTKLSPGLDKMLDKVNKNAMFYLATTLPDDARRGEFAKDLIGLSLVADVEKGGVLHASFHAVDADAAQRWKPQIEFLAKFVEENLHAKSKDAARGVIRTAVTVDGTVVRARMEVPQAILEMLVGELVKANR